LRNLGRKGEARKCRLNVRNLTLLVKA
jgi:hypothetical protein